MTYVHYGCFATTNGASRKQLGSEAARDVLHDHTGGQMHKKGQIRYESGAQIKVFLI